MRHLKSLNESACSQHTIESCITKRSRDDKEVCEGYFFYMKDKSQPPMSTGDSPAEECINGLLRVGAASASRGAGRIAEAGLVCVAFRASNHLCHGGLIKNTSRTWYQDTGNGWMKESMFKAIRAIIRRKALDTGLLRL